MLKLLGVLVCGGALLAAADKIVGGPVVVNATQRSATVVWVVSSGKVTLKAPDGTVKTAPALRGEQTTFTGLQPNTRYDYSVPMDRSMKGWFKTPPTGDEPYRFVVYGDTRTRHDVHKRVIDTLVKHGIPDFVMHTGDLVENGMDNAMWPIFFGIEKQLLRQTVFFPSLGNHERNSRDFFEFFQASSPYYSFNWGKSHFIVMNSDLGNAAGSARLRDAYWKEQTQWLEDDLKNSQSADLRFVVAHHPPYTSVKSRQGGNAHMTALVPMFEKYKLTAAFFGHDHNYQHYLKNGIHYVVTGGGGAPLYDVDVPPAEITQKVMKVENFLSVSVKGKTVRAEAIAIDGRRIEEFEIAK